MSLYRFRRWLAGIDPPGKLLGTLESYERSTQSPSSETYLTAVGSKSYNQTLTCSTWPLKVTFCLSWLICQMDVPGPDGRSHVPRQQSTLERIQRE